MRVKKWHFAIFAIFLLSVSDQISWSKSKEQKPNIDWGIGIICRSDNNYESDKTGFPDKRIAVYGSPRGTLLGTIGRVSSKQEDRYSLNFQSNDKKTVDVSGADKIEIVYEGNVLIYYKEDPEYANILTHTHPDGVWIRKADLIANNFKVQGWLKFLVSRGNWEYHYKYNNLELKKAPNTTSETVASIKGDLFQGDFGDVVS
jgi:hypothetical protein